MPRAFASARSGKLARLLMAGLLALVVSSAPLGLVRATAWADETAESEATVEESIAEEAVAEGEEVVGSVETDGDAPAPEGSTSVDGEGANIVDPTQRADNSFIYDTSIESLTDQVSLYNNKTVQVVGEVIGDRIDAGTERGYCWVALSSIDSDKADSTISILLSAEQADQIDLYGRYGVAGTTLQVRGTFHAVCNEHEGLPDIHAANAAVIAKGVEHPDVASASLFMPGIFTVFVGFCLMGAYLYLRERMR